MKLLIKILTVLIVLSAIFGLFLLLNKRPMENSTNPVNNPVNQESFASKWDLLINSKTVTEEKSNAEEFQEFATANSILYTLILEDSATLKQIPVNDLSKIGAKKLIARMSVNDKNFPSWSPIDNNNIFILMRE